MSMNYFAVIALVCFSNLGTSLNTREVDIDSSQEVLFFNNDASKQKIECSRSKFKGEIEGDIITCEVDENPLGNVLYINTPFDKKVQLDKFIISELNIFTDNPQLREICGNYVVQSHGLVKLNVQSMMNSEDDPHHYNVTPTDLAKIEKADLAIFERKPAFEVGCPNVILQEVISEITDAPEHLAFHLQSYLIARHIVGSVCAGDPSSCDENSILKRGIYYDRKENQCLYLRKYSSKDFERYYSSPVEEFIALLNAEGGFDLPDSLPEGVKYYSFESIIDPLLDLYNLDFDSIYSGSGCSHHSDDVVNYPALSKKINGDLDAGKEIVLICTVQTESKVQNFIDSTLTDEWVNRDNVRIVVVDEMLPSSYLEAGVSGISSWIKEVISSLSSVESVNFLDADDLAEIFAEIAQAVADEKDEMLKAEDTIAE